jgi:CelD/BcsL family acetyltransferase involved in cellulose biosynthesis
MFVARLRSGKQTLSGSITSGREKNDGRITLRIEIAETVQTFTALAGAWRKLASEIPDCHFTQTYDWCRLGWERRVLHPNDKLRCVTAWEEEKLVAVWPFIQRRKSGKPRRLDPIGCGLNEEYADPLLAPIADNLETCKKILQALMRGSDILHVQFLVEGSNMQKAIEVSRRVHHAVPIESFQTDRRSAPNWNAFMSAYPSKFRANLRSRRKHLSEEGILTFELAESAEDQAVVIDWILDQKQAWLERKDKSHHWFHKPETRAFLLDAATLKDDVGRMALFSLKLNGVPLAAALCTVDRTSIEMQITTFDPAYSRFSPGNLMIQDLAQWGFERQLVFDMRTLKSEYKERWANQSSKRASHFLLLTARGIANFGPVLLLYKGMQWIEATLSPEDLLRLKGTAKRMLHAIGR